jgi:hypothetical protein
MGIIGAILVGFVILAAIKELVPLAIRLVDSILIAVIRAPFRLVRILLIRVFTSRDATPYRRGLKRATAGTAIVISCLYSSLWFPLLLGVGIGDLSSPADHPGLVVWVVALAFGLLWMGAGLRGCRGGDFDYMAAFWAALVGFGALALLWWHFYPDGNLLALAAVKTLYVAGAGAGMIRWWCCMPPIFHGNALRRILRHIQTRARPLRPVRPRSFRGLGQ